MRVFKFVIALTQVQRKTASFLTVFDVVFSCVLLFSNQIDEGSTKPLVSKFNLADMSKKGSSSSSANDSIFEYLEGQNRPYSTNDITLNLQKATGLGKTAVQKALDLLVADGKVSEKVNGKQKAYVVNQDLIPTATDEELRKLDEDIKAKTAEMDQSLEVAKVAEAKLKTQLEAKTISELKKELVQLESDVDCLKSRLEAIKSKVENEAAAEEELSKEDKAKLETDRKCSLSEWRKRKRNCEALIDAIMEGYPKSKKILMEEVGLETDEEHKVVMPSI